MNAILLCSEGSERDEAGRLTQKFKVQWLLTETSALVALPSDLRNRQ